ncbi:hypothetical protein KSP40_PGU013223 [Platanthera guangdongensis]|uniref:Uncharacterized protein n=1 Tax=Platanthera guangdongensis TaxID=2320717 RepID=A0ABR2MAU5_9ASPA
MERRRRILISGEERELSARAGGDKADAVRCLRRKRRRRPETEEDPEEASVLEAGGGGSRDFMRELRRMRETEPRWDQEKNPRRQITTGRRMGSESGFAGSGEGWPGLVYDRNLAAIQLASRRGCQSLFPPPVLHTFTLPLEAEMMEAPRGPLCLMQPNVNAAFHCRVQQSISLSDFPKIPQPPVRLFPLQAPADRIAAASFSCSASASVGALLHTRRSRSHDFPDPSQNRVREKPGSRRLAQNLWRFRRRQRRRRFSISRPFRSEQRQLRVTTISQQAAIANPHPQCSFRRLQISHPASNSTSRYRILSVRHFTISLAAISQQ